MRCRGVTLLVALYLALDFANPMMPGAVQLVGGSLEAVAACHARSGAATAPAITMLPCRLAPDLPRAAPALQARQRVVPASPPVLVPLRTPLDPRSTAASSSDDD